MRNTILLLSIICLALTAGVDLFAQEIRLVGTFNTPGYAFDVSVQNNVAYVADGEYGLRVIDVSNPEDPDEIAYLYTGQYALGVVAIGEYAYVMDDGILCIIDISEPDSPEEIGSYDTEKGGSAGYNLSVVNDRVYLADRDGLRVINISNPENPTLMGFLDTRDQALDVIVVNNYAYIANRFEGLIIVDISNIDNMSIIGNCVTPGGATGITVVENQAYIADDNRGLRIIDISNLNNPVEVGYYDTPGMDARDVMVIENIAYVSEYGDGLRVIEVSDPENPEELDVVGSGLSQGMDIDRNFVYVASRGRGLKIYDISEFMSVHSKSSSLPEFISMYSAYPNPFNSTTTIRYGLPYPSNISLQIYNPFGQRIGTLFEGFQHPGIHTTMLSVANLPSGLYFVQLEAAGELFTQKVMLVR